MRILYFFTFDYSLHTLKNSGSLDREIQYFEYMYKIYNHKFLLVTYGDDSDFELIKESEAIKLLPIYSVFNNSSTEIDRPSAESAASNWRTGIRKRTTQRPRENSG